MSAKTEATAPGETEATAPVETDQPLVVRDAILQVFASMAQSVSFSITLFVRGQIISGETLSYKDYLEKTFSDFGQAIDRLSGTSNQYQKELSAKAKEYTKAVHDKTANHIHLKNVSISNGSGPPIPWKQANIRIRLSAVDGFILGRPGQE